MCLWRIEKKISGKIEILPEGEASLYSHRIMASRLRNNKDIKGFQIIIDEKIHSIKISQLADDTTLFCTSKEEIYIAFNEIETFGSINEQK
jgi:hypothetical protein